ncbi:GNAT family N-acetyltransferase [Nonomuraea rhodomycinica]|uniref:GNAT family N-acetyltransferase n=1 Tax=Nonomuraea rhodomycinica TaxID=1712872 RepID=A0A7Y6IS78_9ACTN|nr:GNAT family N-acetyltransferase [Nonomuraea rhodomycinica]NUW43093.1 GNAT family N-acetyltransferase [Nonomuraea rhodomycinica]
MAIEWTALSAADLPAIADLARRCAARDGGLPAATSPPFLARRYATGTAVGAFADGRLVACGAVRAVGDASAATGLVDPAHRGRGLGSGLLDRLIGKPEQPAEGPGQPAEGPGRPAEGSGRLIGEPARPIGRAVRLETESLTPEAHALFLSRGFRRTFAEDVCRRDLTRPLPAVPLPPELETAPWSEHTEAAFHAAYSASFADRPRFPGWTREQWVDWLVDDEFLPCCSLVASEKGGAVAGFVACAEGFLIQVGAVPGWRRRGLAKALAVAALGRMRARGATEVYLDVNVDNPASAGLFRGLGFEVIARRARYEPVA